jgi:D-beta-D-heptose 7-phosphate kinase/D-beta-D-heptose 1-phosphate adenosyltransferase
MSKIVLVTGGFDPLHSGHIALFKEARKLGDKLVVGLNSDEWLRRKKGKPFMPMKERLAVVEELRCVDQAITFNDTNINGDQVWTDGTAIDAIEKVLAGNVFNVGSKTASWEDTVIFANGGDRTRENIPEVSHYYDESQVQFVFGVGGEDKKNSSSWLLENWKAPKVVRSWGHYRNLYKGKGFMVKELVINPHSSLSMQRHQNRSETWNLVSGEAEVLVNWTLMGNPFDGANVWTLAPANPVDIAKGYWHKGRNKSDKPAHIIEIWKGETNKLTENDIERWYEHDVSN